jgi:hypothetical protein
VESVEINTMWQARPTMPAALDLAVACAPTSAAQGYLGQSAVAIRVRTAPIFGFGVASGTTSKINYIGKAESLLATGVASVLRGHQVNQLVQAATKGVKVTDARGIPPRGWPV